MDRSSIPQFGLTTVVEPPQPRLDIVFIHGLKGHPQRTWIHKTGQGPQRSHAPVLESHERPSKYQKIGHMFGRDSREPPPTNVDIFWPRDLVPQVAPDARVMTYGYDTKIQPPGGGPVSTHTVYDISNDLLVALEASRRGEPNRPIIFIAHSLGGIVAKELLRQAGRSQSPEQFRQVFLCTLGLIFFGTPHSGADPGGSLVRLVQMTARTIGFSANEKVISSLLPSSDFLRQLRDEFQPLAQDRNWILHSFQEQYGMSVLGNQKAVEDSSSRLNIPRLETVEHINHDHSKMCKFSGCKDPEFMKVDAALRKIVASHVREKVDTNQYPTRNHARLVLSDEQQTLLLKSLKFDQIDSRYMSIKKAHAKTCQWLLKDPNYLRWLKPEELSSHRGFLWMKGHPGTGKSTIMKYILAHAKTSMKNSFIISFFFNARGHQLERSTVGMYRSLLVQILELFPGLQSNVFHSLGITTWSGGNTNWTVELLKELLEQAIKQLSHEPIVCFIDALDECDPEEIRDMISFLKGITESPEPPECPKEFRTFFSSRHYPHISLDSSLELLLDGQEGHLQDIANYCSSQLKIGKSTRAQEIRAEVERKASGIFMWVVLVVGILNTEYDKGNMHSIRERLKDIPDNLHELFRNILTRDTESQDQLLLCIQWVLFSETILKPEQLYFAIRTGLDQKPPLAWDQEEITMNTIQRYILNSSKGLVETTKSKIPSVQFIHESVRDFLLKENGLRDIWPGVEGDFAAQAQDRLKECCHTYLKVDLDPWLDMEKPLEKASAPSAKELRESLAVAYPLLEYSSSHVFHHADKAENLSIPQKAFIQTFDRPRWIIIHNIFEKFQTRRYPSSARMCYLLAEFNTPHLIRSICSASSSIEIGQERYGCPVLASLCLGHNASYLAFCALLTLGKLERKRQPYTLANEKALNRDFTYQKSKPLILCLVERSRFGNRDAYHLLGVLRDAGIWDYNTVNLETKKTLLFHVAANGDANAVRLLIESNGIQLSGRHNDMAIGLHAATGEAHLTIPELASEIIQLDLDCKNAEGRTPFSLAAENGHIEVMSLLLATGNVNPESKDHFMSQTPFSWAATNGHTAAIKLLLDIGKVNPDSRDFRDRSPLTHATSYGHTESMRLLLDTGKVDPDSADNTGRTHLSWAAEYGYTEAVKLLLDTGKVDPDSKDISGRSPFSWATGNNHIAVMKLLLDTGKVDPDSSDYILNETPLSRAAYYGHTDVIRLLLDTGKVDPDLKDSQGRSPLSWAAENGEIASMELLLDTGNVDPESRDVYHRSPLNYAVSGGRSAVIDFLSKLGVSE